MAIERRYFAPPDSPSYPVITINTEDDGSHHVELFAGPMEVNKVWEGTPEELVALVLCAQETTNASPYRDIPGPTGAGRFERAVDELTSRVK